MQALVLFDVEVLSQKHVGFEVMHEQTSKFHFYLTFSRDACFHLYILD